MNNKAVRWLASGLGLGYLPLSPGTYGTLWGVLFFYLFRAKTQLWFVEMAVVISLFSIVVAHLAEKSFGQKDCQKIVIDEVAGMLITYAFVPFSLFNLILGFVFFRFFDITKIFPANWVQDHVKGGCWRGWR